MFLEEISRITGLPVSETISDYTITNVGGKILSISNFKKLVSYDTEKIVISIKNDEIIVVGKDLFISMLSADNIFIKGKISKYYLKNEEKNANEQ